MSSGRSNQKARTRKAIVEAAGKLLARGDKPSLDEIAELAQVSRATAYRYFPGLDALLSEAAVDLLVPAAQDLLGPDSPTGVGERLALVDEAFDAACRKQELPLRLMLARTLDRSLTHDRADGPLRQNRRTPLIAAALEPVETQLGSGGVKRLADALAMIFGTEGFIALTDVVGLDAEEAQRVRRWATDALLKAALDDARS